LTRLLKINPDKVDYWIWMSSVVDTAWERIYCLQEALKLDPKNATAKHGPVIMGANPPDESLMLPPGMMLRRKWQAADAFDQALTLDGTLIDAYLDRGEMYLAEGDGKSARADFNLALLINSRSFEAKMGLGRANLLEGLKCKKTVRKP